MASQSEIPRELLLDNVREALDKQVKVSMKKIIKMEIRPEKIETRVLAFSAFRVFILTAKVPSKLESSFHFLEIQAMESKKANQLMLIVDGKTNQFFADGSSDDIDHIITHIGVSLKNIFPSYPLERLIVKVDVQPTLRLKTMNELIKTIERKDWGSCGGFTTMYQCMCDFHGQPLRDEVVWDIDTIYLSHDCKELRLQDFDHLTGKDLVPIIGALEHNTWFKQLNASNVKLTLEACNELIKVMKRNSVLEEINLSNTGIKMEFVQKLSLAIISNSGSQLKTLDLSNNALDDKAINHLLGGIKHLSGMTYLDISKTGISTKCLNKVGEMLIKSPNIALTTLKLSDNGQKGEDFLELCSFLAQAKHITYLDLSSTDCTLDTLVDPLLRGCPSLRVLKASKTVFTHKKSRELMVPNSWKQFFASACCLEHVDFSGCRLPSDALKELLFGISCNRGIKALHLDVSSNDLGVPGAFVLYSCIAQARGIKTLDISNNGLDTEMKPILIELAKNSQLKSLLIGRNFSNIKPKNMPEVMNTLVQMLQEETCQLESLSLADSKLKTDTTYIINALGSNNFLLEIDLSGNLMGDFGARMLAKALLINTKLQKIIWDRNTVTSAGFEDVAEALKQNMTLKQMPIPICDAVMSMSPPASKRTEVALQKIETCLLRNNSPRRFASDQAYRLQQGFLISSTQQTIDRLVVQLEDTVEALKSSGNLETFINEIKLAESLIDDANKSKLLLPGLQDISLKSQASGNPISLQLTTMSTHLADVINIHLQSTALEMLTCAKNHCPVIMSKQVIQDGVDSKLSSLPKDFLKDVLEGASTDIFNTASEINLSIAALISDSVVEDIIDSLTTSFKQLSNHLNLRKSAQAADKSDAQRVEGKQEDNNSDKEISFEISKKRNVLYKKARPQSTIGEDESDKGTVFQSFLLKSGGDAVVLSNKTTIDSVPKIEETDAVLEVVSSPTKLVLDSPVNLSEVAVPTQHLQHVTKARPRREKAHRPTRPIHMQGTTEMSDEPSNGPLFEKQLSMTGSTIVEEPAILQPQSTEIKKKPEEPVSKSDNKKMPKKMKSKDEKEKETKDSKELKKGIFGSGFPNMFKKREDRKKSSGDTSSTLSESGQEVAENKQQDTLSELANESPSSAVTSEVAPVEKLTPPPRTKHILHDRVAILPPVKKLAESKESKNAILAVEEDSSLDDHAHEKDISDDITRLPAGATSITGGKNIIQELKEKRFSKLIIHSPPEEGKKNVKPIVEANNNLKESLTPHQVGEEKLDVSRKLNQGDLLKKPGLEVGPIEASKKLSQDAGHSESIRKLSQDTSPNRLTTSPMKRPVSTIVEHEHAGDSIPKSMTTSTPELMLSDAPVKPRPPPPLKPKPQKRDSNKEEKKDLNEKGQGDTADAGGVVYDSATLRLPVREKIKRISQGLEASPRSSTASDTSAADSNPQDHDKKKISEDAESNRSSSEKKPFEKDQSPPLAKQSHEDEIMV